MEYEVCPAQARSDRDTILDLWRRNLPGADEGRFHWLYERGPARVLILRDAQGEAVGSAGMMARTFSAFGRALEGAQAVDLNVDRRHRTIGPALALQKAVIAAAKEDSLAVVYGLPNPQSEPVLRRAGYREIGPFSRWVKPLSVRKMLETARPKWLVGPAVAGVDALLQLASAEGLDRLPGGLRVERLAWFDRRVDGLFRKASQRVPIIGQRTAEYLAWRFGASPGAKHHALGLVDTTDRLLAYVVYRRRRGVVCLNDFLAVESHALEVLLTELLRRQRRRAAQAAVANYLGRAEVSAVFRRLGFWRRVLPWKAVLYADPRHCGPDFEPWWQPDNWHLTRADLDTDE